ncbi:N-acetylglucosamine kinase [Arthrobacter sp. JSM 101049]|uniref:N-acetylglucosamine kinase n=1 Tax=Arthrobacter sp. JSM 101049 TaxID=929097 RepID=UPI003566188F
MPEAALAIDGGQTGIRAQVRRADGSVWDGLPVYESRGILTHRPLAPQIADVVGQARAASGLAFSTVSAGLSGLTDGEGLAPALLAATAGFGTSTVRLVHDSVSSYLGALGDSRGAVVAAGTGSVTLAVGAAEVVRIDGWGYIMGDAGSGYWLGREALVAVMRAFDGRGPATALTDVVGADFPDLSQAYVDLQRDPDRIRRTASYAAHVARLAETDEVARGICDAAAEELALAVATGLRRVGEDQAEAPAVCFLGGVLRGDRIRSQLTARLAAEWPHLEVREPLATSLEGAAMLPWLDPDSALAHQVLTARA